MCEPVEELLGVADPDLRGVMGVIVWNDRIEDARVEAVAFAAKRGHTLQDAPPRSVIRDEKPAYHFAYARSDAK